MIILGHEQSRPFKRMLWVEGKGGLCQGRLSYANKTLALGRLKPYNLVRFNTPRKVSRIDHQAGGIDNFLRVKLGMICQNNHGLTGRAEIILSSYPTTVPQVKRGVNSLGEHRGFVCIEAMESLLCCWYIKGPRNFAFETSEDEEGLFPVMEEECH